MASTIELKPGSYIGFDSDKEEIGFGTRKITLNGTSHILQGRFKHGTILTGQGKQYFNVERTKYYFGNWVNGKKQGHGTYINAQYNYTGSWMAGKMNGKGKIAFANGDKYHGNFKNGEYDGYGEFVSHEGFKYEGTYEQHTRLDGIYTDSKNGCTIEYKDGEIFENNCRH